MSTVAILGNNEYKNYESLKNKIVELINKENATDFRTCGKGINDPICIIFEDLIAKFPHLNFEYIGIYDFKFCNISEMLLPSPLIFTINLFDLISYPEEVLKEKHEKDFCKTSDIIILPTAKNSFQKTYTFSEKTKVITV